MKIMVAEYAVGSGVDEFMVEGKAMLGTLVKSFVKCGHEVFYPTAGSVLGSGTAVLTPQFEDEIPKISKKCDAGLIIAPDEILGGLTEIVEENTANLGCPSGSVRLCADKLKCTRTLEKANIPVPETIGSGEYDGDYVVKPRFGCASEGIYRSKKGRVMDDNIATRFIEGKHLSVSLITGKTQLILSVNRQLIEMNDTISYMGGEVGYFYERNDELMETAKKTSKILGCRGYSGVDIVLGDKPYVVDVNPRPTTSIIGIKEVLNTEIADLILRSRFGELPAEVNLKGSFIFKKEELLVF
jgi:predicted ATP-grasp superfamily ATP-dependent carboligase